MFCPEPCEQGHDLHARMFAPFYGIAEDPATGSGSGCLAAYLLRHRYMGTAEINISVEQGYEIRRPSVLYLRAAEDSGKFDLHVGGQVIMIASGRLL